MFQYIKNHPKYPFCSFYKTSSSCGTFGIHNAIAVAIIPTNPNSDKFFIYNPFPIFQIQFIKTKIINGINIYGFLIHFSK